MSFRSADPLDVRPSFGLHGRTLQLPERRCQESKVPGCVLGADVGLVASHPTIDLMADVGVDAALHRVPVRSMVGECLEWAELTRFGVHGDRAYAVMDGDDGRIATGKYHGSGRGRSSSLPKVEGPGSTVEVTFPGGAIERSDSSVIDAALSAYLERDVALVRHASHGQTNEELWGLARHRGTGAGCRVMSWDR